MLHAKLKSATAPYHARLDALLARVLLTDSLTPPRYAVFLAKLHGFVAWWEPLIARVLAPVPEALKGREKTGWLREDLKSLHHTFDPRLGEPPFPFHSLSSRPAALGSMYVMEGATLGGQIVAPRIRKLLGLAPNAGGTAYFESYGVNVGSRWRQFVDILNSQVDESQHPDAINAACSTFMSLERCLGEPLVVARAEVLTRS